METIISTEELKRIIKEVVEEVIRKELLALRLNLLPYVDNKEQEELEKLFGKAPDLDEVEYEEEINLGDIIKADLRQEFYK